MVLDGSERVDAILQLSMPWDVMGGVARRSWARNEHALTTSIEYNGLNMNSHITLPYLADEQKVHEAVASTYAANAHKK